MKLHTKTAPVNYFNEQLEIYNYINTEKPNYYPVLKLVQQASFVHNGCNQLADMQDMSVAYNFHQATETAALGVGGAVFFFTRPQDGVDFTNLGFVKAPNSNVNLGCSLAFKDNTIFVGYNGHVGGVEIYQRVGNDIVHQQTIESELQHQDYTVANSVSALDDYLAVTGMEASFANSVTIYRLDVNRQYVKQAILPMEGSVAKHVRLFDGGKGLLVVEDNGEVIFYTRKGEDWCPRMSTKESYVTPKKYSLTLSLV